MTPDTKIIHFTIIEGNDKQIKAFTEALMKIKSQIEQTTEFNIEFLVTNDKYQLRDVKYLIKELYMLYKMEKKLRENPLVKSEEDTKK